MGFMGLNVYHDSDKASDFVWKVLNEIGLLCEKEFGSDGGSWNTPGHVNIALFVEAFLNNALTALSGLRIFPTSFGRNGNRWAVTKEMKRLVTLYSENIRKPKKS